MGDGSAGKAKRLALFAVFVSIGSSVLLVGIFSTVFLPGSLIPTAMMASGAVLLGAGLVILFADAWRQRAAWISAALYAVFSACPRIEGFTANAEIFTLAPLVLNSSLVWSGRWFWAGVVTSIAFQLKPSGVEGN